MRQCYEEGEIGKRHPVDQKVDTVVDCKVHQDAFPVQLGT